MKKLGVLSIYNSSLVNKYIVCDIVNIVNKYMVCDIVNKYMVCDNECITCK